VAVAAVVTAVATVPVAAGAPDTLAVVVIATFHGQTL